ncbi:MAG TPA: hypothetical protein VHJ17_05850 [Thermomonospora sp.]|nr:hypothetical protein [Thermomonospora sp.]
MGPPLRQPPPPGGSPYPWAGATPGQGRGESKVNRVLAYALASTTALMVLLLVAVAALIRANDSDDPGVPGRTQQPGAQSSVAGPPPGPAVSETPAATGGTPLPGATPPGTLLKEYKGINLTSGYTIDFLGDAEHPREGYDGDLRYSSDSITADRLAVLDPGQPGTYEACRDNTRYTETLHEGEGYERGGRFCAFTDHGLVALVKVTGAQDDPSDYITIDLTIWQGAPTVSPSPTE